MHACHETSLLSIVMAVVAVLPICLALEIAYRAARNIRRKIKFHDHPARPLDMVQPIRTDF